jgi:PleD family two-component response regulator
VSEFLPKKIFLIDDDADDCFHFEEALKEIDPEIRFNCRNQCEGLLPVLVGYMPDLIFLDINMPVKNGFDCMKEIRSCRDLKKVPIVMFSTSQNERDINISFGFGASLFFHKPGSYEKLRDNLKEILQMDWFDPGSITMKHYEKGKYFPFPEK